MESLSRVKRTKSSDCHREEVGGGERAHQEGQLKIWKEKQDPMKP